MINVQLGQLFSFTLGLVCEGYFGSPDSLCPGPEVMDYYLPQILEQMR